MLTEKWHTLYTHLGTFTADLLLHRSTPPSCSIVDIPRPCYTGDSVDYGGIAIGHSNTQLLRIIVFSFHSKSFEVLVCYAKPTKLVLVTVYTSSNQTMSELFFHEFTNLLEITSTYASEIIVLGDYNIDIDNTYDANAQQFLDLLDAFGLQQHITGSTYAHGHTLDLVITRSSLMLCNIKGHLFLFFII